MIGNEIRGWHRKHVTVVGVFLTALAVVLGSWAVGGPTATAASTQGGADDQFAVAIPAAVTMEMTAVPLEAGSNQLGWIGFPTTSTAILGGNEVITAVWTFNAATQTWSSDSASLPEALRNPIAIGTGDGLFVIASEATDLMVVTKMVSTELMIPNPAEIDFYRDQTAPSEGATATLTRTPNGLHIQVESDGLFAGAYTGWWRIWNNPSACAGATCAGPETVEARWAVIWGTGGVVSDNGIGTFQAFLGVGADALPNSYPDNPDMRQFQLLGTTIENGTFLDNPGGAQVDFVLKWHGVADADATVFFDQTHNQVGSCEQFDPQGTFGCVDIQVSTIHVP